MEKLPLPMDQLPAAAQRFGNPDAPVAARGMAARGLVPVKGHDLVSLLVQLAADPEAEVRNNAVDTLTNLPKGIVQAAAESELHPAMLDALADHFSSSEPISTALAANHKTHDSTVERMASRGSESLTEVIAVNQQRLLGAPRIIEALYKNRNTRMSTADRLIELAARNEVDLPGIPCFKEHVQAIRGELIPEPTDEPLPDDELFKETLNADSNDDDVIDRDKVDGTETVNEKHLPLRMRVGKMKTSQKVRLALVGDRAARALLVRDTNKLVAGAAIRSPAINHAEAATFARSKEVSDDTLNFIAGKKDWVGSYDVKKQLVFNPKTPTPTSMRFVNHMRDNDLRTLARSRNVAGPIKTAAQQRINKKEHGRKK